MSKKTKRAAAGNGVTKATKRADAMAITEITVAGFKSISNEQTIEIRPLTILAGANSSGKSSIMQPLLLLKQTCEASYDAGPLVLNGPNVKFSSTEEMLSRTTKNHSLDNFAIGVRLGNKKHIEVQFRKEHRTGFRIEQMDVTDESGNHTLWPAMSPGDIIKTGLTKGIESFNPRPAGFKNGHWEIVRNRCFLELSWVTQASDKSPFTKIGGPWQGAISHTFHLPGLRGDRERTFALTAAGPSYPGLFDKYTASVIYLWQLDGKSELLAALNHSLQSLALTGGVKADRLNDVQLELRVGRLPDTMPKGPSDAVNIADVGIGVPQVLPVLVALLVAQPGQLVYIEQPEIHLHPRAQVALAQVLADAANRGVQVVAETHSNLLLLGVQSLVAEGKLAADKVKLHWFSRHKTTGATTIKSADMDDVGRFPDWPEDFDDVTLEAQKHYLDSASRRMFAG
jgi:predicted ATPase